MVGNNPLDSLNDYESNNIVAHMIESGESERLYALLALETQLHSHAWYHLKQQRNELHLFFEDLNRARKKAELESRIDQQCRFALMQSSIRTSFQNISPRLLHECVEVQILSEEEAISIAQNMNTPILRCLYLTKLSEVLSSKFQKSTQISAWNQAEEIKNPLYRLSIFLDLKDKLSPKARFNKNITETMSILRKRQLHYGRILEGVRSYQGMNKYEKVCWIAWLRSLAIYDSIDNRWGTFQFPERNGFLRAEVEKIIDNINNHRDRLVTLYDIILYYKIGLSQFVLFTQMPLTSTPSWQDSLNDLTRFINEESFEEFLGNNYLNPQNLVCDPFLDSENVLSSIRSVRKFGANEYVVSVLPNLSPQLRRETCAKLLATKGVGQLDEARYVNRNNQAAFYMLDNGLNETEENITNNRDSTTYHRGHFNPRGYAYLSNDQMEFLQQFVPSQYTKWRAKEHSQTGSDLAFLISEISRDLQDEFIEKVCLKMTSENFPVIGECAVALASLGCVESAIKMAQNQFCYADYHGMFTYPRLNTLCEVIIRLPDPLLAKDAFVSVLQEYALVERLQKNFARCDAFDNLLKYLLTLPYSVLSQIYSWFMYSIANMRWSDTYSMLPKLLPIMIKLDRDAITDISQAINQIRQWWP